MSQVAVPTTFTSATWSGTAAALGDASDATYAASPQSPIAGQTFLCDLASLTDPGVDTTHQIVARVAISPVDGEDLTLVLQLENSDDASIVAYRSYPHVPNGMTTYTMTLSTVEAASIHSYSGLRVRGWGIPYATQEVAFTWTAVVGATTYTLRVATEPGGPYTDYVAGYVLTYPVMLPVGTYFSRVQAYDAGGPLGDASAETLSRIT